MAINAPPLRRTLQEFQRVVTQVIGDGSRVRVSETGVGLGIWKPWTPTLANLTLGNGVVIARYRQIGKDVKGRFKFTLGSTSAVGTSPTFTTPVTASSTAADSDGPPIGVAYAKEVGANTYPSVVHLATTTTIAILTQNATATNVQAQAISAMVPFTWATTDVLSATFTFEAA